MPGSGYSVSEDTPPANWDLTSATCSDGSSPANVDVGIGETVTCTFTNRKRGQIIIGKNATPDDPQDFSFTTGGGLSPASFQLDDDGDELNALASTRVFGNVVPGTGYSVAETTPVGWDLTSSVCSDGSSVSNIGVSPGETVTCTFTNRKRGNIVVLLDAQPDDPQDFGFTTSGGLSPSSFSWTTTGTTGTRCPTRGHSPPSRPGSGLRRRGRLHVGLAPRAGDVLGRLAGVEHRGVRRGDRDLHVPDDPERADAGGQGRPAERSAQDFSFTPAAG